MRRESITMRHFCRVMLGLVVGFALLVAPLTAWAAPSSPAALTPTTSPTASTLPIPAEEDYPPGGYVVDERAITQIGIYDTVHNGLVYRLQGRIGPTGYAATPLDTAGEFSSELIYGNTNPVYGFYVGIGWFYGNVPGNCGLSYGHKEMEPTVFLINGTYPTGVYFCPNDYAVLPSHTYEYRLDWSTGQPETTFGIRDVTAGEQNFQTYLHFQTWVAHYGLAQIYAVGTASIQNPDDAGGAAASWICNVGQANACETGWLRYDTTQTAGVYNWQPWSRATGTTDLWTVANPNKGVYAAQIYYNGDKAYGRNWTVPY